MMVLPCMLRIWLIRNASVFGCTGCSSEMAFALRHRRIKQQPRYVGAHLQLRVALEQLEEGLQVCQLVDALVDDGPWSCCGRPSSDGVRCTAALCPSASAGSPLAFSTRPRGLPRPTRRYVCAWRRGGLKRCLDYMNTL
jgi:hypothetical protein